jgi:alginate O-acetyltransferase complex protein AlgI
VAVSLGTLAVFKYAVFVEDNLNTLARWCGRDGFQVLAIALPVGISFYTFQSLTYTIDLYRGSVDSAGKFREFACFVAFFPSLMAGPILRYNQLHPQLAARTHTLEKFSTGAALFVLGLSKKVLLANPLAGAADLVFAAEAPGTLDVWFGALTYTFYIYYDFSGYSDMAIGLARILGFEVPRNFNAPYLAESLTEFWRRWHISLSSWLRDYLYIPLGGNRVGPVRTYLNLAAVMFLCGLWHGPKWTFIVWGLYHGTLLVLERPLGKKPFYAFLPKPARIAATLVLVTIGWVLFRAADLQQANRLLAAMFAHRPASAGSLLLSAEIYTRANFVILALCTLLTFQPVQALDWVRDLTWPKVLTLLALFAVAVSTLSVQSFSPFLYLQF